MPMTGRSLEIASLTSLTDFYRPTSIGMIEPGNSTEFRSGKIEMISGTSMGPSGFGFLEAMLRSYTRRGSFASRLGTHSTVGDPAQPLGKSWDRSAASPGASPA